MAIPWITIIMAVVSFFLAGGSNKEKRGKAALIAAGVGAATYYTTNHTDWGRENLGGWDGVEVSDQEDGTTTVSTGPTSTGTTLPAGQTGDTNGLWSTLGAWLKSPAGQVSTGTAAASAFGVPSWALWAGGAAALYLILKD